MTQPAPPAASPLLAHALLAHAPVALAVVTGADHALVYANTAFHVLAASAGDAACLAVGSAVDDALPADAARALVAVLDGVRGTGRPGRGVIPVPSAGGGRPDTWPCTAWPAAGPVAEQIVVAVDASPVSASARLQHRDVTERVLLSAFREQERADGADVAREAAEAANAAGAAFLAATSHELRTPLQAIGGYTELMELGLRGPVTDGQRDALARIQHAMRHLLELTTTLLDHSRLEAVVVE